MLIHSSCCVQSEKEEAERRNQPDDEGWVTVGRGGRNPAAPRLDAAELQERRRKKKKVRLKYMPCNKANFTIQKLLRVQLLSKMCSTVSHWTERELKIFHRDPKINFKWIYPHFPDLCNARVMSNRVSFSLKTL